MNNAKTLIVQVSRAVVGIAFLVLMGAVILQVVGRWLSDSPVWTEELTRFALLFLAAFGAGLSYRSGDLVNVDLLHSILPPLWRKRLQLFAALATATLCIFLIIPASKFTAVGALQTSPALSWPMHFIYVSVFILIASLLVFSLLHAWQLWQGSDAPDLDEEVTP